MGREGASLTLESLRLEGGLDLVLEREERRLGGRADPEDARALIARKSARPFEAKREGRAAPGYAGQDILDPGRLPVVDRAEELEGQMHAPRAHPADVGAGGLQVMDERLKGRLDPRFEVDGDEGSHGFARVLL